MSKLTLHDLREAKNIGRTFTEVRTSNVNEAMACAEAGIDIIMCMKEDLPLLRPAVPDIFLISANYLDQPHIASPDQAVAAGFELMNLGADAVYSGMSMECVSAMAREYIPVIGHIGFVPYRSTWIGGTRAVGKTADEATQIFETALAYEDAGAFGVEIEITAEEVTRAINEHTDLVLASMGAGPATIQYLFASDILGTNTGHIPRHAKVYGNIGAEEARVQQLRIEAFKAFVADTTSGAYPAEQHSLKMKAGEAEGFLNDIQT